MLKQVMLQRSVPAGGIIDGPTCTVQYTERQGHCKVLTYQAAGLIGGAVGVQHRFDTGVDGATLLW